MTFDALSIKACTEPWESFPDAIVRLDSMLRCTSINPAAKALVGSSLGNSERIEEFYSRLVLQPSIAEQARRVLQTGKLERTEFAIETGTQYLWMDTWMIAAADIDGLILAMRDISHLKKAEELLRGETERDPATGLLNHAAFHDEVSRTLQRAEEHGSTPALVLFDLDYLKSINDIYGHRVGDQAIQLVSEALRFVTRSADLLARLGGDEFAWLVPDAELEAVVSVAQRALAAIGSTSIVPGVYLSASAGAAIVNSTFEPGDLFDRADAAVYEAKAAGRGVVVVAGVTDIGYESCRCHEERPLEEAAPDLSAATDVGAVARAALREWVNVLAVSGGCIDLLDEQQGWVQACAYYRFGQDDWKLSTQIYRLDDYPNTARAIAEQRTYTCRVDQPDADPAETALLRERGFASLLLTPLVAGNRVLGIVEVFDTRHRTFTSNDQRTAIALARHLAALICAIAALRD